MIRDTCKGASEEAWQGRSDRGNVEVLQKKQARTEPKQQKKNTDFQPRMLNPATLAFKNEEEIKTSLYR